MDKFDSIKMQDFCESKKQKENQDTKNKWERYFQLIGKGLVSLKYGVLIRELKTDQSLIENNRQRT